MKRLNLEGQRFGRLVAVSPSSQNKKVVWLCQCDCGESKSIAGNHLRSGKVKSCGCLRRDEAKDRALAHGHNGSRTHTTWKNMRSRCKSNPYYKGRVEVCKRWDSFENFLADMGEASEGLTIERINNDGDYEPSNCRWATRKEQSRNTRRNRLITLNGETRCLQDWADKMSVHHEKLRRALA